MSSPSTPRSTRAASPTANSPMMLTPGQKIKAMMAAFDSDSESDSGKKESTQKKESPKPTHNENQSLPKRPQFGMQLDSDSSADEEEDIVMPKGRMAARMQAQSGAGNAGGSRETAFERVSKALREDKGASDDNTRDAAADEAMASGGDSDDDDLPKAGPRRRAANTTPEPDAMSDRSSRRARRDDSPLFVSSAPNSPQTNETPGSDTDNDEESRPRGNSRFLALVAQKRKEREEKERLEAEKKAAIARRHEEFSSEIGLDEEDSADEGAAARKLTQQSRPARKASKKALEDMNRETQRMSRNMQLAHQAQTKKKITKESFFARFNFMQPKDSTAPGPSHDSSSADGSQHSSDVEAQKNKDTPQTSPVLGPADKPTTEEVSDGSAKEAQSENTVLPPPQPENPIVGQAEIQSADPQAEKSKKTPKKAPVQVNLSRQQVAANQDSDDELEIITSPAKCRRYAAFENLPLRRAQEPSSMTTFRALAHLTSPTRRSTPSMADFSAQMLYKARQQALKERSQRIQELRDKGIHVETAAERAAMEDEIENLVEKARLEGEEIAKKEKAAKRRDAPDDDDDEDDDYQLSGSDDELAQGDDEDEDEEEEDEDGSGKKEGGLIDSEAGEDDDSDDNQSEAMSDQEVEVPTQRRKRPTRVISDDEDEEQVPATPVKPIVSTVTSVERPQIPGLPSDDKTMSLTQAFAGTLGGSQQGTQQDPSTIPTIPLSLPDPAQMPDNQGPDSPAIIKDSQEQRAQSVDLLAGYSESVTRVSESPAPRGMSYFSQVPDPTQDEGFVFSPFDPSKRFLGTPTSTIETVRIDRSESRNASPIAQRKKKALRRGKAADLSMVVEQDEEAEEADEEQEDEDKGDFEVDASAFNIMKKAARKPSDFDKKKSKARDVVEEAAEESDDEYAGLGGASDDDEDEENMFDRQMINDNSGETVDEKQLAALNALHQRNTDEKQVAKLLKDITTGALRRRKNNDDDLDLDDSDDELMARRREKQREFARMRKALLADSKVGEIAENPKKAAFFKAVEDRDDDDDDLDLDFLNYEENSQSQEDSSAQNAAAAAAAPGQQDTADESNKRKRPLEPSAEDINNRPPPHLRRKPASALSKKPATLAEVRETVSFLTERPEYDSFHEDASMDDVEEPAGDEGNNTASEEQQTNEQPAGPSHHPRRTKGPVVDRLALLRQASSNSATSSSNNRFAFHAGSGGNQAPSFGFRPPMLRKTTTGSSSSSTSTTSDSSKRVSKPPVGGKKGGAVNYYTAAREKEREKALRSKNRGGSNITALLSKHSNNRLGALGGGGQWE
ncbi:hypothetical protein P168DRAFT_325485 [Aspergillus campestris IBT 28561]|uniref:DNA replication checkpoint mediator MRC1 domain-containing protein n=1 Tax=Aspergillus campestris (strain IBT 28561) TaxID=1392248 RepID=A0A2I1D9V5_ASPC2|nr:uncharacterized protein P168DRAFT_325485 [Aspergillus campestris IBT 28561]PKY06638.1 hypothetical protein P168DRAFT_325485 [Aspergillus campestris IBT 28561]